jgi:hypothetical protein
MRLGGVLLRDLVYSFEPHEAAAVFQRWFASAVSDPTSGYSGEELRTQVRSEHSTFGWLLEPMLGRAGFENLKTEHAQSRTYSAYGCQRM